MTATLEAGDRTQCTERWLSKKPQRPAQHHRAGAKERCPAPCCPPTQSLSSILPSSHPWALAKRALPLARGKVFHKLTRVAPKHRACLRVSWREEENLNKASKPTPCKGSSSAESAGSTEPRGTLAQLQNHRYRRQVARHQGLPRSCSGRPAPGAGGPLIPVPLQHDTWTQNPGLDSCPSSAPALPPAL